jgi:hypothetical protein
MQKVGAMAEQSLSIQSVANPFKDSSLEGLKALDLNSNQLSPLYVGANEDIQDIDGMELNAAAQTLKISIDELWRRIKNGKLIARTVLGKVFVYTDIPKSHFSPDAPLPPTQEFSPETLPIERSFATTESHTVESHTLAHLQNPGNQEWALLLDHLSLAKEENREILRLTQDSMSKLTQMTESILSMKDSIIASKEEQLSILKERLAVKEIELGRALKERENLETLTKALTESR